MATYSVPAPDDSGYSVPAPDDIGYAVPAPDDISGDTGGDAGISNKMAIHAVPPKPQGKTLLQRGKEFIGNVGAVGPQAVADVFHKIGSTFGNINANSADVRNQEASEAEARGFAPEGAGDPNFQGDWLKQGSFRNAQDVQNARAFSAGQKQLGTDVAQGNRQAQEAEARFRDKLGIGEGSTGFGASKFGSGVATTIGEAGLMQGAAIPYFVAAAHSEAMRNALDQGKTIDVADRYGAATGLITLAVCSVPGVGGKAGTISKRVAADLAESIVVGSGMAYGTGKVEEAFGNKQTESDKLRSFKDNIAFMLALKGHGLASQIGKYSPRVKDVTNQYHSAEAAHADVMNSIVDVSGKIAEVTDGMSKLDLKQVLAKSSPEGEALRGLRKEMKDLVKKSKAVTTAEKHGVEFKGKAPEPAPNQRPMSPDLKPEDIQPTGQPVRGSIAGDIETLGRLNEQGLPLPEGQGPIIPQRYAFEGAELPPEQAPIALGPGEPQPMGRPQPGSVGEMYAEGPSRAQEDARNILAQRGLTPEEARGAIQEPEASRILQRPQEGVREAGSERRGIQQGIEGNGLAREGTEAPRQAEAGQAKPQEEISIVPKSKAPDLASRVKEESQWALSHKDEFVKKLSENKIINGDSAAELLPSVHENPVEGHGHAAEEGAINRLAADAYRERLAQPAQPGEQVMIMVGNAAVGKSTLAESNKDYFHTILDINSADPTGLTENINAALRSGREVVIQHVHAPIEEAVRRNVARQKKEGRPVPIRDQADMAVSAPASFKHAYETFENDPNVTFASYSTTPEGKAHGPSFGPKAMEHIEKIRAENSQGSVLTRAQKAYTEAIEGSNGRPTEDARAIFERGLPQEVPGVSGGNATETRGTAQEVAKKAAAPKSPAGQVEWGDVRATREIPAEIMKGLTKDKGMTADFLGGQQIYEKALEKLGLKPDATMREISSEVMNRIGKVGSSIKETSLKVYGKMKELGKDFADAMAQFLHNVSPFGKGREGEIGAINPAAIKRYNAERLAKEAALKVEAPKSEAPKKEEEGKGYFYFNSRDNIKKEFAGEENKDLRHDLYSTPGMAEAKTYEEAQALVKEKLKKVPVLNPDNPAPIKAAISDLSKQLTGEDNPMKAAAVAQDALKQGKPIVLTPEVPERPFEDKVQLPFDKWAAHAAMIFTGKGWDIKKILKPSIDMDYKKVVPKRDLGWLEVALRRLASPSHLVNGSWGTDTGAMSLAECHITDMAAADSSAYINQVRSRQFLTKIMGDYNIPNNSAKIRTELRPLLDEGMLALDSFNGRFRNAQKLLGQSDISVKDAIDLLRQTGEPSKLRAADRLAAAEARSKAAGEAFLAKYKQQAIDYRDARIFMLADSEGGIPEEVKKAATPDDWKAAKEISEHMQEYRKVLKELGMPTREGGYMPHEVQAGLSKKVRKALTREKAFDFSDFANNDAVDPESIKFMSRTAGNLYKIPDLVGTLDNYYLKASNLIARRTVANKWVGNEKSVGWTTDNRDEFPHLADKIEKDVSDYVSGNASDKNAFLDKAKRIMMFKTIALSTKTGFKHIWKIPLTIAEIGPIKTAEGLFNYIKGKAGKDTKFKDLNATIDAIKGKNYFSQVELGTGDMTADKIQRLLTKSEKVTHQPVQAVESHERGLVLMTKLMEGFKAGLSPEEAAREAIGTSLMVNFSGLDKPEIMRGSVASSVLFLQHTPWKLMELQIRRNADIFKGLHAGGKSIIEGQGLKGMAPEMRKRFGIAMRNAVAIAGVMGLDKLLDTNMVENMAHFPALAKALLVEPLKEIYKTFSPKVFDGEEHEFSLDFNKIMMNGVTLVPAVEAVLKSNEQYGNSSAFWEDILTPNAVKDLALEPTGFGSEKLGEGTVERNLRNITGAVKESEVERQEEFFDNKRKLKQNKASQKYENRWTLNPLR